MAAALHLARQMAPLVDFIYPPRCPSCGAAVAGQAGLCTDCWSTLEVPEHAQVAGHTVPVYAATYYNETSRKLVLAYKHGGRIALCGLLARLIAARMPEPEAGQPLPLLVPVPLHRWRLWSRGFNQAALLAQALARQGKGEAAVAALMRFRRTPNLGGLGREARERVLTGAIRLAPGAAARLRGRDVVLVDDVLTSGATSRACLAAISAAAPASVALACFARVEEDHKLAHP
ncbi:ComF family protein [Porphyrobacter sp. AAP82]|uniref:ComF family protein n=1 Tax=Porphyrobacter sp. AAP82 TaxID=1248917 RepID=UPI0002EC76D5|nr:double zinc ribbon domain-containing protein [Porphyrobacter sp. AAP82]